MRLRVELISVSSVREDQRVLHFDRFVHCLSASIAYRGEFISQLRHALILKELVDDLVVLQLLVLLVVIIYWLH